MQTWLVWCVLSMALVVSMWVQAGKFNCGLTSFHFVSCLHRLSIFPDLCISWQQPTLMLCCLLCSQWLSIWLQTDLPCSTGRYTRPYKWLESRRPGFFASISDLNITATVRGCFLRSCCSCCRIQPTSAGTCRVWWSTAVSSQDIYLDLLRNRSQWRSQGNGIECWELQSRSLIETDCNSVPDTLTGTSVYWWQVYLWMMVKLQMTANTHFVSARVLQSMLWLLPWCSRRGTSMSCRLWCYQCHWQNALMMLPPYTGSVVSAVAPCRSVSEELSFLDIAVLLCVVTESARDLAVIIGTSCHCQHMLLLSEDPYFSSFNNCIQQFNHWQTKLPRLIQAFVSYHLDYCNSLLHGVSDGLIWKLQSVQNAAARLIIGARWRDHIMPVLHQLHWLPVQQQVVQSRMPGAPVVNRSGIGNLAYLTDDINRVADSGHHLLQSATDRTCIIPHIHNSFGDRSFSTAGPRVEQSAIILKTGR